MLKHGVVQVKKDGKTLLEEAYGYRDYYNKIPNTIQTSFGVASGAKFFTALGILKLVDQGMISLDGWISEYLGFKLNKIDPKITVRQLLNHTSGVPNYFDELETPNYEDLWKDFPNYNVREGKDLIPLFIDKPNLYEKGERFEYNDTGFVLLGLIIEDVLDTALDDYISEIIIEPLGLQHTGYYELDALPKNTANAYIFDQERGCYKSNIYSIDAKGSGAGGIFLTVDDMYTVWKAFMNGDIISKKLVEEMIKDTTDWDNFGYGLGVWLDENNHLYLMGEDPGVTFASMYDSDNDFCITLISNHQEDVFELKKELYKKYSK